LRRIGAELGVRFRARNVGSRRPALTLEDGTLAVTDNYLKVPAPDGLDRNVWVDVVVTASDSFAGDPG
jgi:hypothetical protein